MTDAVPNVVGYLYTGIFSLVLANEFRFRSLLGVQVLKWKLGPLWLCQLNSHANFIPLTSELFNS